MTPEERSARLAKRWFAKDLPHDPERALAARITRAVRAAIAEAIIEERESIAQSAEAAADAWRPYLREFANFVRARSKAK